MSRVRIGIVSWNTSDELDQCLAAVPPAAEGLDFEVVVVDNDSTDSSVAVAREHHGVTVLVNEANLGYARAMNQALTHQIDGRSAEVLVALNPDTVPPPGSLATLVEQLLADPSVALVAPRLLNQDGSLQHSVYRFPSPIVSFVVCFVPVWLQRGRVARRWWLEGHAPHDVAYDVDWAVGAVHVIRSSALPQADPYCERWFMYVEDMDLCWRLREAGWRCRFEPQVGVPHIGNVAGVQAWGDSRTQRWTEASYDWYRLRRGTQAARRWARANALGVSYLLHLSRLRYRVLRARAGALTAQRLVELPRVLPVHRAMWHAPETAFLPSASQFGGTPKS